MCVCTCVCATVSVCVCVGLYVCVCVRVGLYVRVCDRESQAELTVACFLLCWAPVGISPPITRLRVAAARDSEAAVLTNMASSGVSAEW